MNDKEIIDRLKASKLEGEKLMKQSGLESAEYWCSHVAAFHQIKRLAKFRSSLAEGEDWRDVMDDESGFMNIAQHATAGGSDFSVEEALQFWKSIDVSGLEQSDANFLEGFIEGVELFWKKYQDKV